MSTLAEVEAAADTLSAEDRTELIRHLVTNLREERGAAWRPPHDDRSGEEVEAANGNGEKPRRGLTPEEFEAWLKKARGVGVSGMTTDEHIAMTRGDE